MGARIESTHKITSPMSELTAGELKEFLDPIDNSAKVSVRVQNSDRPGEVSMVTLSADVDIHAGRIY